MGGMAGGGGSRATGGSGGGSEARCRRYAAQYTRISSSEIATWTYTFDRPSVTMTCTNTEAGDARATTWATIEDAVAENRPIGSRRAERYRETIAFVTGDCGLTSELRHDASGRLTAVEAPKRWPNRQTTASV